MPASPGSQPPPERIQIQYPAPAVDDGRYPAKRCVGDTVHVAADIFRDGHDKLRAVVKYRGPSSKSWSEAPLQPIDKHLDGVRWAGDFPVDAIGRWEYDIEAWTDVFGTWRDELERKIVAGQHDLSGELSEGTVLLKDTLTRTKDKAEQALIEHALATLEDKDAPESAKHDAALGPELHAAIEKNAERHGASCLQRPLPLEVDRERARFGAWYELFPRSFGGLKGVEQQIPRIAELGFDVLYLPPIHPIGKKNRKGRNNALTAGPTDPGSPWAIGSPDGGHDAVHPELGTIDDLKSLTAKASDHDIDIALDFAVQASADHPWLTEHPEWFLQRPDGTLKYAENPPKKYQDIYNVNWESPDWKGLWDELKRIMLQWVECGVKVFRVDNPHTKPFAFWEWLIAEVHKVDRDVIFLAEAFTRRAVMRQLAKLGFSQSYTYFTWKNSRWELSQYVSELAYSGEQDYFRPNFFANTPDILHAYLQHGGPNAFHARLVLAATLSPSYGLYSGYENFENVPVREGSEEYLDSEKYEAKERDLESGPLLPVIQRVNEARRANPALHHLDNVWFLETENDALIAYAKRTGGNIVVCVVNIDPYNTQEGVAIVPAELGTPPAFSVHDELTDERFQWRIGRNYVRLDPGHRQAHILRVET